MESVDVSPFILAEELVEFSHVGSVPMMLGTS